MQFESTFPADFRKEDVKKLLGFVFAGRFCQLISLPGGGKATLLKLLACNENLKEFHLGEKKSSYLFVYLNLLEVSNYDEETIDKFLLLALGVKEKSTDKILLSQKLKETVANTTREGEKNIVFLFDHFDEFQNKLPSSFFQTLRTLRNIAKYSFSSVFATRRDLIELVDTELLKEFYDFFVDNTVFMKLCDKEALSFLFSQIEKAMGRTFTKEKREKLIDLTGGHTKLLKVSSENLLENEAPDKENLLKKQLVKASLLELWLFLTEEEKQILISLSQNKKIEETESLKKLVNFELLNQNLGLTIPLFEEFIKTQNIEKKVLSFNYEKQEILKGNTNISDLLSNLEFKLLKFLLENQDRIVSREEIINAVWQNLKSKEGVTDQAVDQLIFRLRKKIEENPNEPKHIQTIKGRGLKFQNTNNHQ